MTKTQICNLALYHLGSQPITDFDTDNTQAGPILRAWFDSARDEMLRSHVWNFATKRVKLTTTYISLVGAAISDSSGKVLVTHNDHGFQTGDTILLENVEGISINGRWSITRVTNHSFTLDDSVYAAGYVSGTGRFVKVPTFDWEYEFNAPDDVLKVVSLEDVNDEYSFESGKILARNSTIYVKYVAQITDTTLWPMDFINAFSLLLTSYIARAIKSDNEFNYRDYYETVLAPMTKVRDSREARTKITNRIRNSRLVNSRSFNA